MTTESPAITPEQIRTRLNEIAPWPGWGDKATPQTVARWLAFHAHREWIRHVLPATYPGGPDKLDPAVVAKINGQFAAAHALLALADVSPVQALATAQQIADAWNDGGEVGAWLAEHLGALGVDHDEAARLAQAQAVLDEAGRIEKADELAKLRNACKHMGSVIVSTSRQMECARIEMLQNGPEKAMQWILNGLPDVDDNPPEMHWDGKESANEWFERTADFARSEAAK